MIPPITKWNFSILLLTCGLLMACRKDRNVSDYQGDYEISGRVLDDLSGNPVPNATVGILEEGRNQTSSLGTKTVASTRADQDGRFTLNFKADAKSNFYYLAAESLLYFELNPGLDISFSKAGKNETDIRLTPFGYLAIRIKGIAGNPKLSLSVKGGGSTYKNGVDTLRTYTFHPL